MLEKPGRFPNATNICVKEKSCTTPLEKRLEKEEPESAHTTLTCKKGKIGKKCRKCMKKLSKYEYKDLEYQIRKIKECKKVRFSPK